MEFALWAAATFLALACFSAAGRKLIYRKVELVETMPWAAGFSQRTIWAIAVAEIVGGIGLILPELTGIFPELTAVAAFCIAALQVGAAVVHARLREFSVIPVNVVLLCVALFIGFGRLWF
jgi:hypothetical protein